MKNNLREKTLFTWFINLFIWFDNPKTESSDSSDSSDSCDAFDSCDSCFFVPPVPRNSIVLNDPKPNGYVAGKINN